MQGVHNDVMLPSSNKSDAARPTPNTKKTTGSTNTQGTSNKSFEELLSRKDRHVDHCVICQQVRFRV